MPRLVIVDTNVVVAGLLTSQKSSPTARLMDSMLDDHHEAPDSNDTHFWALLDCEKNATLITGDILLLKNAPEGRQLVKPSDYGWD